MHCFHPDIVKYQQFIWHLIRKWDKKCEPKTFQFEREKTKEYIRNNNYIRDASS